MTERRLDAADLAEAGPPEAVRLPLELIDESQANPRHTLPEIPELAESILDFGLMQPLLVRREGERYQVLSGHRRLAAFRLLGEQAPHDPQWRSIPAVVRSASDERAYLMLVSAQVHVASWKPREQASALERLALEGMTLEKIGERLHRTSGWVSRRLRVFADSVLSGYVQTGRLAPSIAEQLLPVLDLETKKRLAEQAAREEWSQPQVKARVRALRLGRQVRQAGRLTHELVEILSAVDPKLIPLDVHRDLMVLFGRLEVLAKGGAPRHLPTVGEAEQAAGITSQRRLPRRGQKRTRGYRPKL